MAVAAVKKRCFARTLRQGLGQHARRARSGKTASTSRKSYDSGQFPFPLVVSNLWRRHVPNLPNSGWLSLILGCRPLKWGRGGTVHHHRTTKTTRKSRRSIVVKRKSRLVCAANVMSNVALAAQCEVMKTKTRERPENPWRLQNERNNRRLQGGGD